MSSHAGFFTNVEIRRYRWHRFMYFEKNETYSVDK